MSDFDDPVVREQLQRLAGHAIDDDVAYANLQVSVRAAKRRRVIVASSVVGCAAVILIGASVFVSRDSQSISPVANSSATDPEITNRVIDSKPAGTDEPVVTTPIEISAPTSATPSSETVPPFEATPKTDTSLLPDPATTPPRSSGSTGSTGSSGAPGSTSGPATPVVQTFTSKGGVLTVQLGANGLSVVDHDVNGGYTYKLERNEPDRIRVRFVGDGVSSRIDVVVANGRAIGHVAEIDDTTMNSYEFPNNNSESWPGRDRDRDRGDDGWDNNWNDGWNDDNHDGSSGDNSGPSDSTPDTTDSSSGSSGSGSGG